MHILFLAFITIIIHKHKYMHINIHIIFSHICLICSLKSWIFMWASSISTELLAPDFARINHNACDMTPHQGDDICALEVLFPDWIKGCQNRERKWTHLQTCLYVTCGRTKSPHSMPDRYTLQFKSLGSVRLLLLFFIFF